MRSDAIYLFDKNKEIKLNWLVNNKFDLIERKRIKDYAFKSNLIYWAYADIYEKFTIFTEDKNLDLISEII